MNTKLIDDIACRQWLADDPYCILILIHGMGASIDRWEPLAEYFSGKGVTSYALELKGFGAKGREKVHVDSFDVYYQDIIMLRDIVKKDHPDKRQYILGESMGALISFVFTAIHKNMFDGCICISPAFSGRARFSVVDYLNIFSSILYDREKQFRVPFEADELTTDEDMKQKLDQDEKECSAVSSGMLFEILKAQVRSNFLAPDITDDTLFLLAGDDAVVDPAASERVFKKIRHSGKRLIMYPGMKHALTIEAGREKVFEDIWEWIKSDLE